MSAVTTPEGIPPLYWLLGVLITVGVPALTALSVALVQRPVRRETRQANRNAAAAAGHALAAAESAAHAATELTPNHGSSTKDQATLIVEQLADLTAKVAGVQMTVDLVQKTSDTTSKDVGGIRAELRTEREERLSLAGRLDDHVRSHR